MRRQAVRERKEISAACSELSAVEVSQSINEK